MEKWEDVVGYEGLYQVSNLGRIRSVDRIDCAGRKLRGIVLKLQRTRGEYISVGIYKNGIGVSKRVNRLVAMAFIPNPDFLPEVGHWNDNKQDNSVKNLYWTTAQENCLHNGRSKLIGLKNSRAVIGTNGNGDFVFFVSSQAAKGSRFLPSGIRNCIAGITKTHRGYTWAKAEE